MASNDDRADIDHTRKLDAFLVDNEELEALNARLARFNLFRVLNIERAEIRHSHMLAWLLAPRESHGLGSLFLRRFLSRLLMENEGVNVSLTPARVELMQLDDVEVLREWQNIDIVVHSPSGEWCLVLENKIGAKESPAQLTRYRKTIEKEFPGSEIIPVFLTLEGDDPSEEGKDHGYVSLSHKQIMDLVEKIVNQRRSAIPPDQSILIDHYLAVLRRLTMSDPELVALCKAIYQKHREAIDLIFEYGASSRIIDACEEITSEVTEKGMVARTANRVWFLPPEMALFETEFGPGWGFLPKQYPIWWWFYHNKDRGILKLCMEVGPIADPEYRIRLLRRIEEAEFSFWKKGAFRKEAKYTRILNVTSKLPSKDQGEVDDTPEIVGKIARDLWARGWAEGKKIVEVLKECRPEAVS